MENENCSKKRSSMTRLNSFTYSSRAVLLLALLLTAAFWAACGGANSFAPGKAFEGEIIITSFQGNQTMENRHSIKGTRSRIEPLSSQDGEQASIVLMDSSSGMATTLSPQTKSYATLNLIELAEETAKESEEDFSSFFPKVTSTGETETIAGFTCRHWLIGDTDVCMAQGLGYFGGGGPGGFLDRLQSPALREKYKAQLDANPEFAKFAEDGAFPLKIAVIENGRPRVIMEVTRIERKSLDDSLFTVPADYKKTEIP
jgi:hypothetical protein